MMGFGSPSDGHKPNVAEPSSKPQPAHLRLRMLLALLCIIFGGAGLVLIATGHVLWGVVPGAVGAIAAAQLLRFAHRGQ